MASLVPSFIGCTHAWTEGKWLCRERERDHQSTTTKRASNPRGCNLGRSRPLSLRERRIKERGLSASALTSPQGPTLYDVWYLLLVTLTPYHSDFVPLLCFLRTPFAFPLRMSRIKAAFSFPARWVWLERGQKKFSRQWRNLSKIVITHQYQPQSEA